MVQPVQWIDDTLVYYSLGNLISGQKGTHKRIGMLGGVEVTKIKDGKVKLSDARAELIYTYYNKDSQNFKLMWFDELNNAILPEHKTIYKKYTGIITEEAPEGIRLGI